MIHRRNAFTLIELLIVVAIIGILAAIAIPNFLEAQVRAKVSRTYSDFHALGLAMEMYHTDTNTLPADWGYQEMPSWKCLTTPVAYISRVPYDPFNSEINTWEDPANPTRNNPYVYFAYNRDWPANTAQYIDTAGYLIFGIGPNAAWDFDDPEFMPDYSIPYVGQGPKGCLNLIYDPTNGTISYGELIMTRLGIYNID